MIPKHFLLCSSRFIHTRTPEKIAFRLERPFFNDDGSETESKKKERNKDSLEFTDTTECLQRAQFRLPEQASCSFSFHFPARFQRSPRLRSNFKLVEKNCSGAVQFVSCVRPRRLPVKLASLNFSSFCSFISFASCAVPTRKQNLFFLSFLATTKTQAKIWDPLLCRAWLHIGSLKKRLRRMEEEEEEKGSWVEEIARTWKSFVPAVNQHVVKLCVKLSHVGAFPWHHAE